MNTPKKKGHNPALSDIPEVPHRVLREEEKLSLQETLADHESQRRDEGSRDSATYSPGTSGAPEQALRAKAMLAHGDRDSIGPGKKIRLEKRAGELEEYLAKNMAPKRDVYLRKDVPEKKESDPHFDKVKRHMVEVEMSATFVNAANEWKNILRELGRENESNIERIRPES